MATTNEAVEIVDSVDSHDSPITDAKELFEGGERQRKIESRSDAMIVLRSMAKTQYNDMKRHAETMVVKEFANQKRPTAYNMRRVFGYQTSGELTADERTVIDQVGVYSWLSHQTFEPDNSPNWRFLKKASEARNATPPTLSAIGRRFLTKLIRDNISEDFIQNSFGEKKWAVANVVEKLTPEAIKIKRESTVDQSAANLISSLAKYL